MHSQPVELIATGHQWEEGGDNFQKSKYIFKADKISRGEKNNEVLRTGKKCPLVGRTQILPL